MSHEIESRNGKASMIYVGETPWHELGTQLATPPKTVKEALQLAGLDWRIALEQLQTVKGKILVDSYAIVRDVDGKILGHGVSKDWNCVQNDEGFAFFDPFLESGAAKIETAGSLRGGARVWMLAKIDRPDSVIVKKCDDRVAKYLLLAIGHNGHMSVVVIVTPIRVVCMNTLRASLSGANQIRIPHTKGANDALKTVQETILKVDAQFEKAAELFRKLASIKIRSDKQLRAYVDAVFSVKKAEAPAVDDSLSALLKKTPHKPRELEPGEFMTQETKSRVMEEVQQLLTGGKGADLPGVKGTAWAAYNAVTEYNTWKRGRTTDARLDQLWLKNSGPVERALPAAVDVFINDKAA